MSHLNDLRRSLLFDGVPDEAVQDTARVVIERHFCLGELLLEQDVPGDTLHLLTRGSVRVTRVSTSGRERILGDIYAPGLVGETAVLDHGERSASVHALEEVQSLMLHRQHFEQLLRRHPRMLWNVTAMLARRVTMLNDELIALGQTTEVALAHVLSVQYRQRLGAGVKGPEVLPLTTTSVMSRLGASRETITRVIRRLEGQGLVKVTALGMHLLQPEKLEALALSGELDE